MDYQLVVQANYAIRCYQDLDEAHDRLREEVNQLAIKLESRIEQILKGTEGTLDELRAIVKEANEAKERLEALGKKRREARSAAHDARNKAIAAWATEASLIDIDRPQQKTLSRSEDKEMVKDGPADAYMKLFEEDAR
jgi:hypothetical protein